MIAVIFAVSGCMVGKFMCNYALLPEEHGNDIEGDDAFRERIRAATNKVTTAGPAASYR